MWKMAWLREKKFQWTTKTSCYPSCDQRHFWPIFGHFWHFLRSIWPPQGQMLLLSFVDFFLWIKVVIVDSWYKQTKIEIVFWNTIYTRANHSEKEVQKCARYSFIVHTKGQLISEQICGVLNFPKMQRNFCQDFCPSL